MIDFTNLQELNFTLTRVNIYISDIHVNIYIQNFARVRSSQLISLYNYIPEIWRPDAVQFALHSSASYLGSVLRPQFTCSLYGTALLQYEGFKLHTETAGKWEK